MEIFRNELVVLVRKKGVVLGGLIVDFIIGVKCVIWGEFVLLFVKGELELLNVW